MGQILHIIKYKILSFTRFESDLTPANVIKNIAGAIIYSAFAAGSFIFIHKFIAFLLVDIKVGLFLLHQFISIIFYILFITINIGNMIVSYSTLYKSNEVTHLLSKPVQPVKIFLIKFFDNFFYSSSTLLMIVFSILAGYVYYFSLGIEAFLLLLINSVAFMLSAASLGVIILLITIRAADRFGIKIVLYTLASLYILAIFLFFQINSPKTLVTAVMKYYPLISKDNYLSELIPDIIKFLPNEWLSQSAYWLVKGNINNSLQYLVYQILLTIVFLGIAATLGYKWYFRTWLLNTRMNAELSSNRNSSLPLFSFRKTSSLSPLSDSVLKRELFLFMREPSQVFHSIVFFFLVVIFITSVAGINFVGLGNYNLQTMIYFSIFIFNLLFISTLALRFIFPLISLEGEAFWKVRSSPVNPSQILFRKLIPYTSIIIIISIGVSYYSNHNFTPELILVAMTITLLSALVIISINFGMGGLFANYKEKNVIRLASSQGASLSFLLNIVFMLFLVITLYKPLSQMFLFIMIKKEFTFQMFYYNLVPVIVISVSLSIIFLKIAVNSLKKDL
ncbi:MAG: hypothetical protein CVV24_07440 [Ignavibacteriae bacterium HGW-Ignavibacteriae-3]|nr:MAG: hypothetical protein CVV24_07440 [Ignavibacteriae bacterium HGW-Ignavibacteriae-3]